MIVKESSGKLPIGLYGFTNLHADGLFDECTSIETPFDFNGQYCTAFFRPLTVNRSELIYPESSTINDRSTNWITLLQVLGLVFGEPLGRVTPKLAKATTNTNVFPSISFCLPSSCSADDLGKAIGQLVGSFVINNYSIVTYTSEKYCFKNSNQSPSFEAADIVVM